MIYPSVGQYTEYCIHCGKGYINLSRKKKRYRIKFNMVNKDIIINDILISSLQRLYEMDYVNIKFGVSERNICARLAHHMENIMREYDKNHHCYEFVDYYADVEYNRMGNGDPKHFENDKKLKQYMVADLLIQRRGYRNMLAVEMKREGNNKHVKEDKERLEKLVSKTPPESDNCVFGTLVGAFITYSKDAVTICQFEDRKGRGKQVAEIQLLYDDTMDQLVFKSVVYS